MFRAVGSSSRLIADGSTSPTGTGEFVAAAVTNSSPLPQTMLSATKSSAGSSTPSSNAAARSFRRCGLRAAATGGRFDGRAEAQPGAGNRRGREARAQSRPRLPASQPAVAGIRKEGGCHTRACDGRDVPTAAPQSVNGTLSCCPASWLRASVRPRGQRRGGNLQRAQRIPSNSLKQIGQSEEVAAVIRGLATTMTFVSGAVISVDAAC